MDKGQRSTELVSLTLNDGEEDDLDTDIGDVEINVDDVTVDDNGLNIKCHHAFLLSKHIKCWILTSLLWILIILQIICVTCTTTNSPGFYCNVSVGFYPNKYWWVSFVIFVIILIVYFIEICNSSSFKYLLHWVKSNERTDEFIETFRTKPPVFYWEIKCYHQERRTRTTGGGHPTRPRRTETYYVTVLTHSNTVRYQSKYFRDNSGNNQYQTILNEINDNNPYCIARIKFDQQFTFANNETKKDYDMQLAMFKSKHKGCGLFKQTFTEYEEPRKGFKCYYVSVKEDWNRPHCFNICWYTVYSFLLLLPCYRMWMTTFVGNNKYLNKKYVFKKEFNLYPNKEVLIYGFIRLRILDKIDRFPVEICQIIHQFYPDGELHLQSDNRSRKSFSYSDSYNHIHT